MAICYWDMCFTLVLAGWEETTHDACVFQTAISSPSMNFSYPPQGISSTPAPTLFVCCFPTFAIVLQYQKIACIYQEIII